MSEELIQRKLTEHGLKFGDYEFYCIGSTNIEQLRNYHIIPNRPYHGSLKKKPDNLLVDRRDLGNIKVMAVIENKTPDEFNSPEKKERAIRQCVLDYCKPLGAKIGIVSDGNEFIWINPQLDEELYQTITREDGYALNYPFAWETEDEIEKTRNAIEDVLRDISPTNSQLKKEELQNPSNLADRVWQTIWLASGENPDACLATFVEIFVFKYLSDLGVLITNQQGAKVSFADVLAIDRDKCLIYYSNYVREYIKRIFPASPKDGTSIINGTVLNPQVSEHNLLFYKILEEFSRFGSLINIDPEFKSRLYENFLKKSISQKNWGQFFTPRNIIKAIVEMSEMESLADGAKVHDPACGVGGFILEPLLSKRTRDFVIESSQLKAKLNYSGYDRDPKTIILAKANMLIHLNELVRNNARSPQQFAQIFNNTFSSLHNSILGSLSETTVNLYDLVMTNPPFVVTGTSKVKQFINESGQLKNFYAVNAPGIEGLFVEKIIRSLKPFGKAFIIVPDGIFNRSDMNKLRKFILDECILEGIVSLPENAFYTTPKKTYILAVTKKSSNAIVQVEPVFSYLVINTGETLDTNRFECENDLPEAARLFKYFKADKRHFVSPNLQCKVWNFEQFAPDNYWSIDRWWTEDEKVELGIAEKKNVISITDFALELEQERQRIEGAIETLKTLGESAPKINATVDIELGNKEYFNLFIGKRVLKREIYYSVEEGAIPLYSANVKQPFGLVHTSNIQNFDEDNVLWGIDGNFEFNVVRKGIPFATTDHCGCIRILDESVDAQFLYFYLNALSAKEGFDRTLRASLKNMKGLTVRFPVKTTYEGTAVMKPSRLSPDDPERNIFDLDLDLQSSIANFYSTFERIKSAIVEKLPLFQTFQLPPLL